MKLTIYSLPNCPWCVKAKKLADGLGHEYEEIQQKHPDHPTVPYVMVDEVGIGGFTEYLAFCRKL